MTVTYATLRRDQYDLIPGFGFQGTCSALGTTTTLIDNKLLRSAIDTADDYSGFYIFRPNVEDATDRIRVIDSIAIATGTITIADEPWTAAPTSGEEYEVMGVMSPDEYFNLVTRIFRRLHHTDFRPIGTVADNDMEETGTTEWTVESACTRAKDVTAANVFTGTQALAVTLTGANGGVISTTPLAVRRNEEIYAGVIARPQAGRTVRVIFWDHTNSAEFGTAVTSTYARYMHYALTATVPATCYRASVKLGGTASGQVILFDSLNGPWQRGNNLVYAPSWATEAFRIAKIREASYDVGSDTSGVSDAYSRQFQDWEDDDWELWEQHHAANPRAVHLRRAIPMRDLWYEARIPASDYAAFTNNKAGESVTTALDRTYVAAVIAQEIFDIYIPVGTNSRIEMARARTAELVKSETRARPIQTRPQHTTVRSSYRPF